MPRCACAMFKRLKYYVRIFTLFVLNMFKHIFLRLLSVKCCQVIWFNVIIVLVLLLWLSSDNKVEFQASKYPVILWWTKDFSSADIIQCPNDHKCSVFNDREINKKYKVDAYLFYGSNIDFKDLPLPRNPKDTIWGLFHEESPRNVEELLHEAGLSIFNYSSTFSRFSDVPFPLQHIHDFKDITSKEYFLETTTKNEYLKDLSPVLYLQTDCSTSTERDAYVKELMKFINVDSYGACLNNKKLPDRFTKDYLNNLDERDFLHFIARYKFVIAIENGVCNDYVTEKFWRAIKVGSVPIYFGSPTIRDWFPNNKSAILIADYATPKILSDHLKLLMENDSMYEGYLEHKTTQLIENERLVNEYKERSYQLDGMKTVREFECFVCTKLYDRLNGEIGVSVVDKKHYDCPKPISALTQTVNARNSWVSSWEFAKENAENIHRTVIGE